MRRWLSGTLLIGFAVSQFLQPQAFSQQEEGFPVGSLAKSVSRHAIWWHLPGMAIQTNAAGQAVLSGDGRVFLVAQKRFHLQAGVLSCNLNPGSVLFADQVGSQVRLMVLQGKASIHDGFRRFELTPSQQVVLSPEPNSGYFIDDGIYRRPVQQEFFDPGRKTIVRQFYLEQVVYSDPILRTLYQTSPEAKKLIDRLNKTGAIIRDLNGTGNYEQGQV